MTFLQDHKGLLISILAIILLIILGLISKSVQSSHQSVDRLKWLKTEIKNKHQQRIKLAKDIMKLNSELESITKNILQEADMTTNDNKEINNIIVGLDPSQEQVKAKLLEQQYKIMTTKIDKEDQQEAPINNDEVLTNNNNADDLADTWEDENDDNNENDTHTEEEENQPPHQ